MFPYFVIYVYQIIPNVSYPHVCATEWSGDGWESLSTTNIKPCSYVSGIIYMYICRILTQSPTIALRKLALKALSLSGHQH